MKLSGSSPIHLADTLVATSCRTTLDGGVTFGDLQTLVDMFGDPGLVVDPATDRIWLTANPQQFTTNQILAVWKEPNDPNFDANEVEPIASDFRDKPLPAIGAIAILDENAVRDWPFCAVIRAEGPTGDVRG